MKFSTIVSIATVLSLAGISQASHPVDWFARLNHWTQAKRSHGQQYWLDTWNNPYVSGFGMPSYSAEDMRLPFTIFGGVPPFGVYQYYIPHGSYIPTYENPVEPTSAYTPSPLVSRTPTPVMPTANPQAATNQDLSSFQTVAPEIASTTATTERSKPAKVEDVSRIQSVTSFPEQPKLASGLPKDLAVELTTAQPATNAPNAPSSSRVEQPISAGTQSPTVSSTADESVSEPTTSSTRTAESTSSPVTSNNALPASSPDVAEPTDVAARESRMSYQENLEPNRRRRSHETE